MKKETTPKTEAAPNTESKDSENLRYPQKLLRINNIELCEGETIAWAFDRRFAGLQYLPPEKIVDAAAFGDLEKYAQTIDVQSEGEIAKALSQIIDLTVTCKLFYEKCDKLAFPKIYNFFRYCSNLQLGGKQEAEVQRIAERAWLSMQRRRLNERTAAMFAVEPNNDLFEESCARISQIWGFSQRDIDKFRYFVCLCRDERLSPSLNKELYLWGENKRTGKTTVARTLIAILNGETDIRNVSRHESSINVEFQFNDHDIPVVITSNVVLLDEAMPYDTTKTYGKIKNVLTSENCRVNYKFGAIKVEKCRRLYIFTSNDEPQRFIRDKEERRFIDIHFNKEPQQIAAGEIFDIWMQFCQNATPPKAFDDWYRDFENIEGEERVEINHWKNELLNNEDVASHFSENSMKKQFTMGDFYEILTRTRKPDCKREIKAAVVELFGSGIDSRMWNKSDIMAKINDYRSRERAGHCFEVPTSEGDSNQLPF